MTTSTRPDALRRGLPIVAASVLAYLAVPGHPDVATHGVPWGPVGTAAAAAVIVLATLFRRAGLSRSLLAGSVAVVALLGVARLVIGASAAPVGWTARYYGNEHWTGTPQWSSDFRSLGATRIDRRIDFKDDTFPAYYLNDIAFSQGIRREVVEPMSIEWIGTAARERGGTERITLRARGRAEVHVDGRLVLAVASPKDPREEAATVDLSAGAHALSVRYAKPPNTDGLIEFSTASVDGSGPLIVTPASTGGSTGAWLRSIAWLVDLAVLAVFAGVVLYAAKTTWKSQVVPLALFAGFGAQGYWQARTFANRVVALTGGDDWWGFEACARDILHHGPLMTLGRPVGEGDPYFYHPLYCYFLAAVHGIAGESLFGPVFVQFLILAVVAVVVWRLAAELFGEWPALAGLAALVLIFELDFVRYYTVTLLSENLYFLTVTMTLVPFVRWVRDGRWADLARMGIWGGISSITRPPMMFYLFPALALIALVSATRSRRFKTVIASVALAAAAWTAMVAPVTLRNLVVSRQFILISDVQSSSVLTYNIPPSASAALYGSMFRGTFGSAVKVVAAIARDHPRAMLDLQAKKIGFSLGMIHWIPEYRPHPELIAVTLLYVVMCVASAQMRSRVLWPIHLFVLTHLASLTLTMPWNYGYRMILPPFVYTTVLSVAGLCSLVATRLIGHGAAKPVESGA